MNQLKKIKFRPVFVATVMLCIFLLPVSITADELSGELNVGRLTNFATGLSRTLSTLGSYSKLAGFSGDTVGEDSGLIISAVGFSSVDQSSVLSIEDQVDTTSDDNTVAAVLGQALVYPNPFRQSTGIGGVLGYELSKDMDIDIQIYNMFAQSVAKVTFDRGANGATKGYNTVQINKEQLGGVELSAGVYFYLIMNDGEVLARGKMAVKP